jgi:hypothetical protein
MAFPATPPTQPEQLEKRLLRRGVDALEAGRTRCIDCGRTPLIGEAVHLYEGTTPGIVCELCRMLRLDPPVASETVRHSERGLAVRVTARAV